MKWIVSSSVMPSATLATITVAMLSEIPIQPIRPSTASTGTALAITPRIGTAIHDLSQDCGGWHLRRDIKSEIAITTSWKMTLASRLDGEESRSGNGFRYNAVQVQNGNEREVKGRVQRKGNDVRAAQTIDQVIANPTHPYTQQLLQSIPSADPTERWQDRVNLEYVERPLLRAVPPQEEWTVDFVPNEPGQIPREDETDGD